MKTVKRSEVCNYVGPGWHSILKWLVERLSPEVEIMQVKEKFGGLRFYIFNGTKVDDDMVAFVERMSYRVCEQCGTTIDVSTEGSWIKTLCANCREKWLSERKL